MTVQMDMPMFVEKPTSLQPTQRATDNWGKMKAGEVLFPRVVHTNWLSSGEWSFIKTFIQVIVYGLSGLYLGIYIYVNIYSRNNN